MNVNRIMAVLLAFGTILLSGCNTASTDSTPEGISDKIRRSNTDTSITSTISEDSGIKAVSESKTNPKEDSMAEDVTSIAVETQKASNKSSGDRRNVAYYTSWSAYARNVNVSSIDATLLTHINFAFANLNSDGKIIIGDSWVDVEKPFGSDTWEGAADSRGHFNQLKLLKQKYPHLKTLISVGGWTWSNNFSAVAANETSRNQFAASAVEFLTKYGFDGLDIDWEFPVEGGNNIPHSPSDKENYTKLLAVTRKAFDEQSKKDGKTYLLTIAGGPNPSFTKNTELTKMMEYLDYINIMSYDYHGGWEDKTGYNAPLYSTDPKDPLCVTNTVEAYIKAGVKPEDLNLGLAFYGRGWGNVSSGKTDGYLQPGKAPTAVGYGSGTWEGACFDYIDLAENYVGKNGYKRYFDEKALVPYLYNGSNFITYDDEESITKKLEYADSQNLGGVMFWEFTGDKKLTLQKIIAEFYGKKMGSTDAVAPKATEDKTAASGEDSSGNNGTGDWSSTATYSGGDVVTYNGNSYTAKWWTQGETPSDSEWGAWEKL